MKPNDIPANVVRKYEDNGWKGFKDFLWSDKHRKQRRLFMPYNDAKAIIKNEKINNIEDLIIFTKSNNKPNNFPFYPEMVYQRKGWKTFEEFFK